MAMMGAKPLASLSSGLLARKGQAKPAMRSQGFGGFGAPTPAALEDLGWNDMGHPVEPAPPEHQWKPIPPKSPAVALREALKLGVETRYSPPMEEPEAVEFEAPVASKPEPTPMPTAEPPAPAPVKARPVLLASTEAAPRPVSLATAQRIGRESAKQTKNGKAAFTLRLDGDRHLRLRLASALANRSAQQMVTEAVDRFLTSMPEIEDLVSQLPEPKRSRR